MPPPDFLPSRRRHLKAKPINLRPWIGLIQLLTHLKTMLKGKKTYITGTLAILSAIGAYLAGDVSLGEAIQTAVTAALAMTLRNGISTDAGK